MLSILILAVFGLQMLLGFLDLIGDSGTSQIDQGE